MPDVDAKRQAAEAAAIIENSVRSLAKLLDGKAAILSIRTKYDKTIVFPVQIGGDATALLKCAIDTNADLESLFKDVLRRVDAAGG